MIYLGDFKPSDIVDFMFNSSGVGGPPIALVGGAVKVYKGNSSTTEENTGVTLTASFDTIVGLNHVRIDTSADGAFYTAAGEFNVVLTAGTVDGVSVVGKKLFSFSIRNRSAKLEGAQAFNNTGTWTGNLTGGVGSLDDASNIAASVLANPAHKLDVDANGQVGVGHFLDAPPTLTGGGLLIVRASEIDSGVGNDVATSVLASTIDGGLGLGDVVTMLLAHAAGHSSVVNNNDGTYTISVKKQDDTTEAFALTYNPTTGVRS